LSDVRRHLVPGAARPSIAILADARRMGERQPSGLCGALMRAGHAPVVLDPEDTNAAALDEVDLVVARGRTAPVLALLARAEGMGVRTVNRCAAIALARDRAAALRALRNSGVPTPVSSAGSLASLSAAFAPHEYPVIVKALYAEDRGAVRVVQSSAELLSLEWPKAPAVAQRFVPSDGFDLKLYVIGSEVSAQRTPSPISGSAAAPSYEVPLSAQLRSLARRCGLAFGLELYSVTCIETAQGPIAVAVDDFPDYAGIPSADERLARFVIDRAHAVKRG
jgi:ribosomal protein S6--L-glutamate ligase